MASKQERRRKANSTVKCKACQDGTHDQCMNNKARHVRICDCQSGEHHG